MSQLCPAQSSSIQPRPPVGLMAHTDQVVVNTSRLKQLAALAIETQRLSCVGRDVLTGW